MQSYNDYVAELQARVDFQSTYSEQLSTAIAIFKEAWRYESDKHFSKVKLALKEANPQEDKPVCPW